MADVDWVITKNVSPLRYPGGKTRACKMLDEIIKENFDLSIIDNLVSRFMGGGSFEFYFQNKYKKELIVNDKFTPLYNFWLQVKTNTKQLCDELRKMPTVSKDEFTNYRNTILEFADNMIEQAKLYFIINRCSFSGATLSGGYSEEASTKRYTASSIDRIEALDLSHMMIYNKDFEPFLCEHTTDRSFIFLDPPYYLQKKSKLYGNNGDMHENFDHKKLFDVITNKTNWLMTYNNCEYIRELYKQYVIIDVDWTYGMNKSKLSSEIVILSILREIC